MLHQGIGKGGKPPLSRLPLSVLRADDRQRRSCHQGLSPDTLTPDRDWGIGSWSDGQLQSYLSAGHAEGRGSAGGPMSEVVDNSLRYLTEPDIKAIATYLKSVPANGDGADVAAAPTPATAREVSEQPASSQESGPGLHVFEGACTGCHRFDGKGAVSHYASLVGGRTANDPAGTNATQLSLKALILPSPKPWASCPISARVIPTRKSLRSSKSHWALWNPCLCAQAERDREAAPSKLSGKLHGFTERSLRSLAQRSRRCFTSAS